MHVHVICVCKYHAVTDHQIRFLYASAAILIISCICYFTVEVFQLLSHGPRLYFKDTLNYFQLVTYFLVIIFVFPVNHVCWCYPSWRWQIGAIATFLVWIHTLIHLKPIPKVGQPITMLFNVYINFIWLIYLPILLIATFALPLYMLFNPTEV